MDSKSRERPSHASPVWVGYERLFRSLLCRVRPQRLQLGVELLVRKAEARVTGGTQVSDAVRQVYGRARQQVIRQLLRNRAAGSRGACSPPAAAPSARRLEQVRNLLEAGIPLDADAGRVDFHCDAALGGLARWLRAAGYAAAWWPGIDDDELLDRVFGSSAILLTTDRRLLARGVFKWGVIASLLVPIALKKRGQFAHVASQLDLPRKSPRCMRCGGCLVPVEKTSVRNRIPPKTYPWRDEYFVCTRCDQLFWEGTHWQRIAAELTSMGKNSRDGTGSDSPGGR